MGNVTDHFFTESWRVLRIMAEFVEGVDTLAHLPPAVSIFGSARTKPGAEWYDAAERLAGLIANRGVGVITGTVGINYSHELMHQKNKTERSLGDVLLSMVLYSHFRSEHLLVHHRYVGTPKDPVSARYNEGFYRFFPRVLKECFASAFDAEKAMLARKDKPRSEEHTSELQSPVPISYAVFCLKKKKLKKKKKNNTEVKETEQT